MRLLFVALLLTGCAAGTRIAHVGAVAPNAYLVTLVVTESLDLVRQECADAPHAAGTTLVGCQSTRPAVSTPGQPFVRAVRIVRYTDSLPSPMALEIDAHELCHAVAALQFITDPCHIGNNGQVDISNMDRTRTFTGAFSR
jgi:hypothetical protein